MKSASSKYDASKSVGAVGSAAGAGFGVSTGSVGSGSVSAIVVSGNVVSVVSTVVVTVVVTGAVVVATVVVLVVLIVFFTVVVLLCASELSCDEVTSAQLQSTTAIALIKATADVLKVAIYFISIYSPLAV